MGTGDEAFGAGWRFTGLLPGGNGSDPCSARVDHSRSINPSRVRLHATVSHSLRASLRPRKSATRLRCLRLAMPDTEPTVLCVEEHKLETPHGFIRRRELVLVELGLRLGSIEYGYLP